MIRVIVHVQTVSDKAVRGFLRIDTCTSSGSIEFHDTNKIFQYNDAQYTCIESTHSDLQKVSTNPGRYVVVGLCLLRGRRETLA